MPALIDLAALQDRLLGVFVDEDQQTVTFRSRGDSLRALLERALTTDVRLSDEVVLSFDRIHDLFPRTRTVLDSWKEGVDDLVDLFSARDKDRFERAWEDLWSSEDWQNALGAVGQFGAHQAVLGVSFVTTLHHFTNPTNLAADIGAAYESYFFSKDGFTTVDGITVRQPAFPEIAPLDDAERAKLKGFFGLQTAERYLRDLVRIAVERAGDGQYRLPARIESLETTGTLSDEERALAKSWLAGFGSMSEGLVMSSVEQMTQGVGSFSANPLLAAAASTLAAIAARKATQHAFLWQLDIQ